MGKRILGQPAALVGGTTAPTDTTTALDMITPFGEEFTRPRWWLLQITLTMASDVYVWGAPPGNTIDDESVVTFGLHQDEFKVAPLGKLGTAIPAGTYNFIIDGLGLYAWLYLQNSAGVLSGTIWEILDADRGN